MTEDADVQKKVLRVQDLPPPKVSTSKQSAEIWSYIKLLPADDERRLRTTRMGSHHTHVCLKCNTTLFLPYSKNGVYQKASLHTKVCSAIMSGVDEQTAKKLESWKPKVVKKTFPAIMMDILDNISIKEIVSWSSKGNAFIILCRDRFVDEIIPKYFPKPFKFVTFQKYAYDWSFEYRLKDGIRTYQHPLFQRNRIDLCESMRSRRILNSTVAIRAKSPAPTCTDLVEPSRKVPWSSKRHREKFWLCKTYEEIARSAYDQEKIKSMFLNSRSFKFLNGLDVIPRDGRLTKLLKQDGCKDNANQSYSRNAVINPVDEVYVEDIYSTSIHFNDRVRVDTENMSLLDEDERCHKKRRMFVWPEPPEISRKNTVKLQRGQLPMGSLDTMTDWYEKYSNGPTPYEVATAECGRSSLPVSMDLHQTCQAKIVDSEKKSSDEENIEDESIIKDLLSKCWNRALNRAGGSLTIEVENENESNTEISENTSPSFNVPVVKPKMNMDDALYGDTSCPDLLNKILQRDFDHKHLKERKMTKTDLASLYSRCKEYAFGWRDFVDEPVDSSFAHKALRNRKICYCTFCNIVLFSQTEAFVHFFGNVQPYVKVDNCSDRTQSVECASKIDVILRDEQASLFNSILEKEVEMTIDGILHAVLTRASARVDRSGGPMIKDNEGKTKRALFGWFDVLGFLQQVSSDICEVRLSRSKENKVDVRLPATIDVSPSMTPLPINPDTIQAIALRLVERYENSSSTIYLKDNDNWI